MKPSIGKIVLYTSFHTSATQYPAIIYQISNENENDVGLKVFMPKSIGGTIDMPSVPFSREFKHGCWSFKPRKKKSITEILNED